jgi:peptidoglycan-N-acetylglucosamine deacetylase
VRHRLTPFHWTLLAAGGLALAVAIGCRGSCRVTGLVLVALAQSTVTALGVMRPQWRWFGPAICQVHTAQARVALTFDDGPDANTTPALLDQLARRGVPATFFCIGTRVLEHLDLCRRAVAEGHELENHSHAHHRCTNFFSVARLRDDLGAAQAALAQVRGSPPRFFRPPMGLTNLRVFRVARELRLQVVGWTVRGLDQRARGDAKVVDRLLAGARPGAILLLHDGGSEPARLLRRVEMLVDKLEVRGYQCVRLDQLLDNR